MQLLWLVDECLMHFTTLLQILLKYIICKYVYTYSVKCLFECQGKADLVSRARCSTVLQYWARGKWLLAHETKAHSDHPCHFCVLRTCVFSTWYSPYCTRICVTYTHTTVGLCSCLEWMLKWGASQLAVAWALTGSKMYQLETACGGLKRHFQPVTSRFKAGTSENLSILRVHVSVSCG